MDFDAQRIILKSRTRGFCKVIALRGALRTFPIVVRLATLDIRNFDSDRLVLGYLRSLLVSAASIANEDHAFRKISVASVTRLRFIASDKTASGRTATIAAFESAKSANSVNFARDYFSDALAANTRAIESLTDFRVDDGGIEDSKIDFSDDCILGSAETLLNKPIWPDFDLPEPLAESFEKFQQLAIKSDSPWAFWDDWYMKYLIGEPIDLTLQKEIALIPDADWEAGPEWIAEKIEEIKARFLAKKLPQAETIHFNGETARFYAVPTPITKPDLLGATLAQISDAVDDVLADPGNGLSEQSREVRVLRRTVAKYGNDPQRVEMDAVSVYKSLTRQLLNTELPPSEENLALQSAVDEAARGIRATIPEVAENRRILSEQAIKELPEESRQELVDALPVLVAMTERGLPKEWEQDIPVLLNDAILPPDNFAPALPGADEATRIFSRVSKMAILMRQSGEVVDKIHDSQWYKATGIAKRGITIVGWIAEIVRLGLKIF